MNLKKDKPSIILVLGMHRSGTSLIAQLIAKWGAFMGDDLMQANEYNKDGYWEYVPLVSLNERMLDSMGNKWFFPPKQIDVENLIEQFGEEAREIIDEMGNRQLPWCWKDPRMVFLLPFWKKLLHDHNLIYVISYRNPQSVANSLNKRDNMSITASLALWEHTSLKILQEVEYSTQKIFIEYDSLLDNPQNECERLFNFLNKTLNEQKGDSEFNEMLKSIKPFLSSDTNNNFAINQLHKELIDKFRKGNSTLINDFDQPSTYNAWDILKYYYNSKAYIGFSLQIFVQTGSMEYNEEYSKIQRYHDGLNMIEMDLLQYKNIHFLRFDPLNDWVVIKLKRIEFIAGTKIIDNVAYSSNAFFQQDDLLIFNNLDPQIVFDLNPYSELQFEKVSIFLNYVAVGDEAKVYFSNNYENFINELYQSAGIDTQSMHSFENLKADLNNGFKKEKIKLLDVTKLLDQKISDISDRNRKIERLHINLNEKQLLLDEKQLLLDEKREEVDTLTLFISEKETLIIDGEQTISEQEKTIDQLSENIISYRTELEKVQSEISSLQNSVNNLTNEINFIHKSIIYKIMRLPGRVLHPVFTLTNFKKGKEIRRNCRIIGESGLFDKEYYLKNNPDVAISGGNPVKHYLLHGGFEGRNPSENFDSAFYLSSNPDVAQSGMNPLLHYILFGKKEERSLNANIHETVKTEEGINEPPKSSELTDELNHEILNQLKLIKESCLFDEAYYYSEYPDVKTAGVDALEHYCLYGWKEGRNPSSTFETYYYLSVYKDVKESGLNPLYHYVVTGSKEGRQTQFLDSADKSKEAFEYAEPFRLDAKTLPVKPIAFYLPQFHPIPENDEWWGKNFTEWTNVTKAKPQFEGHYQPHLPLDLGFYDLRIPDVMQQQIELAKNFGIYGFCFYYYRFGGKRLLEKPLDMFLKHKEWNINFCICWANENWTRRWDGQEKDILIAQEHSAEDDIAFIENIAKYIADPRYIKVDNKPLVIIYQPQLFPDIKSTVKRWREHYQSKYGGEIYFTMVQTFGKYDPSEFDFDAAIEFPPHNIEPDVITTIETNVEFIGTIHDAKSLISKSTDKLQYADYELFRGVMLKWDNTARKGRKSNVFVNNEPNDYKGWLENAIDDTISHKTDDSKRLIFINAWNEWAEGTHLEPDQKYGYAYLNATSRALESSVDIKNKLKIGILIHAYYLDVLPEIFSYINNIKEDFTILISVPIGKGREAMTILKNHHYTNYILKEVENVGFDIAPMFCAFQKEIFEYDLICKIHTKKSTHNSQEFGMEWRKFCLETLLKNEKQTTKIIKEFNLHTDLGIIYSPGFPPVMDWIKRNGANLNQIEKNLPELLIPSSYKNLVWPMGSFFWFRPDSLKPIFEQNFTLKDFEPKDFSLYDEKGIARDLTLAHSLERVFCYIARSGGYKTFQLSDTIFDDKLKFEKTFKKSGICPVCNTKTVFFSPDDWFRDHYHCKHCNSIPRNRAIFHVLNTIDKDWKLKRLHESSPNNLYFANVVDNYSSSQFYPDEVLGKIIEGNRNENLEKLTFADEEFDYFITLDVMEHVFNPGEAILEMLRATKKDGTVVFTVPIHKHVEYSIQRARQNKNNRVEYLLPEYYHGNPVGDGKSLVTWDYGKDFKTLVQNWIGNNFEIHIFNEPVEEMGIIGDYLDVIVIKKI